MANSLADALCKVGLIDQQERDRALADQAHSFAEREAMWKKVASKGNRTEHYTLLQSCSSISEFKDTARKLLCESPELASEVVKLAHRFKGQQGGDRLVWLCYQVRDLMPQVVAEKRECFLKRAFRSAGSAVEIPN
ncbi:MAG: hypothetical protein UX94_C0005G0045 [Parcubacteria group bacterium GW2011_GWA2_47_21]|nr:MAG: hypothetical protein UX94_C0005G0045 [Parcubacteria group bacterium GW2011_GWA2_47_21]KKW21669.1 MAG: hypothetical protein UY62_C0020G0021 [Parcubacteria group bacterium GW2011_GWF2_50_9]